MREDRLVRIAKEEGKREDRGIGAAVLSQEIPWIVKKRYSNYDTEDRVKPCFHAEQ